MAETHDTIKSLLAEFRGYSAGMPPSYHVTMSWADFRKMLDRFDAAHNRETVTGSNQLREALVKARRFIDSSPLVCIVDDTGTIARGELCAEIDAAISATATAEKSSAVGDAAKLREALEFCVKGMCGYCRMDAEARGMTTECVNGCEALLMAKAALAAPPRNCDKVKTSWDVLKKWHEGLDTANDIVRMLDWLLAPATEKEGAAK